VSPAVAVQRYPFDRREPIFVDANVWLRLFGPAATGAADEAGPYSRAFAEMLKARSPIYIDVTITSEFVNRFARLIFETMPDERRRTFEGFKAFRDSRDYVPVANEIAIALRKVLRYATRISSGFDSCDILTLIAQYEQGGRDFNDLLIEHVCRSHRFKLLTHDGDFRSADLDVITANGRLLEQKM
jgi:predicted nucleic acid-binding protein